MLLAQTSQPGSDEASELNCHVELDLARQSFFMQLLKVTEVRGFQLCEGWVQRWGELPGNDKW